jgi:hypothetical protein
MSGAALLRALSRFVPRRVVDRPSMQILRARLAVALRQRQTGIGPGVPIVGEIALGDNAGWRRDVTLLLWTLAQEAIAANDRLAWLICTGLPGDEPLEDLYALAVQAGPVIQLHVMHGQADADQFSENFVPPASLEEKRRRVVPGVHEALAEIAVRPGAFGRVTSARSAAHTLVKQLSMGRLAVAVDVSQVHAAIDTWKQGGSERPPVRFLVTGDPLQAPVERAATGDIIFVRRLGLSFLDELALIRFCDAYVGACDHSAMIAADAGIPCLLESDAAADYSGRIRCAPDLSGVLDAWICRVASRPADPAPHTICRTDS